MIVVLMVLTVFLDGLILVCCLLGRYGFLGVSLACAGCAQAKNGDHLLQFAAVTRRALGFFGVRRKYQKLECVVAFLAFIFKYRHNTSLSASVLIYRRNAKSFSAV